MRNQMPLLWIEEAEARTVLASARFDQEGRRSAWSRAQQDAAQLLYRLRLWFAVGEQINSPHLQMQPAMVRRPAPSREHSWADDESYCCRW